MNAKTAKKIVGFATIALTIALAQSAMAWTANGYSWPGSHPRIPYYVSDSLNGFVPYDGSFNDGVTAIQNAANEWNTHGGSELKFSYAGTTSVTTVADDGINAIIYNPGQCPAGNNCRAILTTHQTNGVSHGFDLEVYKYQGGSGLLISWAVKSNPLPWDTDLWTGVLHEMGHALGLGHSTLTGVVMSTTCGPGCKRRTLFSDDLVGAQAVNAVYTNEGIWTSTTTPMHGSTFSLTLSYPEAAGKVYLVTLSLNGMSGFALNQITPTDSRRLATDAQFFPTQNYPAIFQNFIGVLDASGHGIATVTIPNNPGLAGLNLYFSAVTMEPTELSGLQDVGVAVPVTVQ